MYDTTSITPNNSSLHKPFYYRMHKRLQDNLDYARRVNKIRSKTVEPVLGTLINFTNMRRIHTRGINSATKCVLIAATVYNLKKYLKWMTRKAKIEAAALLAEVCLLQNSLQSALNSLIFWLQNKLIFRLRKSKNK